MKGKLQDNPNFPELRPFVIYNPDDMTYLTSRIKLHGGGYCTYWAKDYRKAKFYRTKKHATAMMHTLRQEGRENVMVLEVDV